MNNNSDGLSPTLRAQLGTGWNRALPSAFGFDNGIYSPGGAFAVVSPPRLSITPKLAKGMPDEFTIEIWTKNKIQAVRDNNLYYIEAPNRVFTSLSREISSIIAFNIAEVSANNKQTGQAQIPIDDLYHQIVIRHSKTSIAIFIDGGNLSGGFQSEQSYIVGSWTPVTLLTKFYLLCGTDNRSNNTFPTKNPVDEFRLYKKALNPTEISINWNLGRGSNPPETEFLDIYYKFEEFEMLDFSMLQDNSDMRLGIRDLSGNYNHAEPINLDTNPASANYVLKPF